MVGVAVFAEKGEGRFLSCLYAWLVVGIYVEHCTRVGRLQFEEVQKLPQREFVDFGKGNRIVEPTCLGQGVSGRLILRLNKFFHGVTA